QDLANSIQQHHAANGRKRRRAQQAVIAADVASHDGGRSKSTQAVGEKPFLFNVRLKLPVRFDRVERHWPEVYSQAWGCHEPPENVRFGRQCPIECTLPWGADSDFPPGRAIISEKPGANMNSVDALRRRCTSCRAVARAVETLEPRRMLANHAPVAVND